MIFETENTCSGIKVPLQKGPICWFMGIFVAMFYSQKSRKILKDISDTWDESDVLFKLLKNILYNYKDYKFNDVTFQDILRFLYNKDSEKFMFHPFTDDGGLSSAVSTYIGPLYNLLNIDYTMFEYNVNKEDFLIYSLSNEEFNNNVIKHIKINTDGIKYVDHEFIPYKSNLLSESKNKKPTTYSIFNKSPPPILIVHAKTTNIDEASYNKINKHLNIIVEDPEIKKNVTSMNENITYMGSEYELDSIILASVNKLDSIIFGNVNSRNKIGHVIAGITCKNKRYVYNGWAKDNMDPSMGTDITKDIPCQLMEHDWAIKNNDFCLNTTNCILDEFKSEIEGSKLCFNFRKGQRVLIYVKKKKKFTDIPLFTNGGKLKNFGTGYKNNIKATKSVKSPKKCPEGKVLNPKTGRCILIKNAKTLINKSPKSPKKCPEGKVLNPKTGRCILIKNAKALINKSPKSPKSPKKCPEGKVLNPKTGRCILIKNKHISSNKFVKKVTD